MIGDSSLCFVNCHLAAGQHAVKQRNSDVAAILEEKGILDPSPLEAAYVRGGDGTMVMDHEFVLVRLLSASFVEVQCTHRLLVADWRSQLSHRCP